MTKIIDTGFYWYDPSNMDQPKIQKNLYQYGNEEGNEDRSMAW